MRAAKELNPSATLDQLSLNNPKGLHRKCKRAELNLKIEILKRLKSPSDGDYKTFFMGTPNIRGFLKGPDTA